MSSRSASNLDPEFVRVMLLALKNHVDFDEFRYFSLKTPEIDCLGPLPLHYKQLKNT